MSVGVSQLERRGMKVEHRWGPGYSEGKLGICSYERSVWKLWRALLDDSVRAVIRRGLEFTRNPLRLSWVRRDLSLDERAIRIRWTMREQQ